ncbi:MULTISPECIES: hypothetical protein [Pseudoalteromonas]|uniref:Uncharacterized protein n=1 Tax=Pseudoalteromonas amylolytica TaxID=1859457 RepID=A0A1S1MWJ1_9GAMM|nr:MULTISPECIES: hypothetical protein [Pseudoalteromonas]MCF6436526.1 hypothetical protein [Pseudoalteromonas sp. MMG022]OHU86129.1 hypothetical protein BFC16_15565 [Pseudoalteromonas sp. JW3]OHU89764.1 hypothetical protein BET10_16750 [Pseudoalteromonas amylolytica]
MLGRLKTRMLVLGAIVIMSVGVLSQDESTTAVTKYTSCTCETSQNNDSRYCRQESEVNWYSWFRGESGSAQFHYLDLLELLLGSDRKSDSGLASSL